VKGQIARFDPALVESLVAKAPTQFTQLARNPQRNVVIGGNYVVCAPMYGPPFVRDLERGRREATIADFRNFVKLAWLSPHIHHSGGTLVEPNDLPVETRHLDMLLAHMQLSDKPFMGSVTSAENAADSVAMAEIVFGKETIRRQPALLALINVNSPRRYDARMLGALKTYARARQAVLITPFLLAGCMSPVTVASALAQQNAEALAGIALVQMIEPGCPVIYGSFLTSIDFSNGLAAFGSPDSMIAVFASAQLARRYRLPFRGGGALCSAKLADAQAATESALTLLPTVQAGTNFVLHAAGWLENGLVAGYEKFVLDCEMLGALAAFRKGINLSDESLALDAIVGVPPGGQHLESDHTLRHFRHVHRAELFDTNSFEQWERAGSEDAITRANKRVRQLLASCQPPPLDSSIEAGLKDFVASRKTQLQGEK
jgi:trimethylamine--corrinoid protein Co-methyltransferase